MKTILLVLFMSSSVHAADAFVGQKLSTLWTEKPGMVKELGNGLADASYANKNEPKCVATFRIDIFEVVQKVHLTEACRKIYPTAPSDYYL